jgi:hypothetical protein
MSKTNHKSKTEAKSDGSAQRQTILSRKIRKAAFTKKDANTTAGNNKSAKHILRVRSVFLGAFSSFTVHRTIPFQIKALQKIHP